MHLGFMSVELLAKSWYEVLTFFSLSPWNFKFYILKLHMLIVFQSIADHRRLHTHTHTHIEDR